MPGVYEYYRESAYPWGVKWPRRDYTIMDKDTMYYYRKELSKMMEESIPHLKGLPEKELQLPYDKYIVPKELFNEKETSEEDIQLKTYDPFTIFNNTPSRKREDLPFADFSTLNLQDNEAILEFTNKHGLLGIFFHRYKYLPLVHPADGYIDGDDAKATFQFSNNTNKQRNLKIELQASRGFWFGKPDQKEGLVPVSFKQINDSFFPFRLDPYEPDDISLKYFCKLFPHLAKVGIETPVNWWDMYCEPLCLFVKEAELFRNILSSIFSMDMGKDLDKRNSELKYIVFQLKNNLENIHPTPKYSMDIGKERGKKKDNIKFKDGLLDSWEFPSLLSAYYLMLYMKLSGNRESALCKRERCKRPFFRGKSSNEYCSEICQSAEKTKRKRDSLKESINEELKTRNLYLPEKIEYLFVMGVPDDKKTFFSYRNIAKKSDYPFIRTVYALYPQEYYTPDNVVSNRDNILKRFQKDGFYAVDVVERNLIKEYAPITIKRHIDKLTSKQTNIFLVGISEKAIKYLRSKGYNVINQDIIPYPDSDKDNRYDYVEKIIKLLRRLDKKNT